MASVTMNQIDVPVFGRCLKMENALVELVVTLDVGPRIIRFAVPGKANMMAELPDMQWENGWKIWGGHRLWAAPESMPLTYELDNTPCEYEILENGVRLWRQKDPISGLSKEIEIGMDGETSVVDILHRIRNDNPWEIEYAAWALTVLAPGGREVVPFNRRDTGLLANRTLALWPYSRMNDPRVWWGERYMTLDQQALAGQPAFKVGMDNESGWAAYFKDDCLFVKYFMHDMEGRYPDGGMSFETYTNERFLEMESLSPIELVAPGGQIEHVEVWELMPGFGLPEKDDDALEALMGPIVDSIGCDGDCDACGHDDCHSAHGCHG